MRLLKLKLIFKRLSILILLLSFMSFPGIWLAQTIPPLSFSKLDGSSLSMSELQGHIVVIAFSSKENPLRRYEMPQLERVAERFANQGVIVLWVSINSKNPDSTNYASDEELLKLAAQYPELIVLRDPDKNAARKMKLSVLPTIIIIDSDGKQIGKPYTGIDPQANLVNELSFVIKQLLMK